MGLSLSTDNIKRIYVLNSKIFYQFVRDMHVALVVELSSRDLEKKFLKKKF